MNTYPKNGEKLKLLTFQFQDASSIVHDFSPSLTFRDSEDFHASLLSAAQAEHTKVRERALRLLELERIRHEQEVLRSKADAAEERVRIETEKAFEACRIRDAENKARQIPKPAPLAPVLSMTEANPSILSKTNNQSKFPTKLSNQSTAQIFHPTSESILQQTVAPAPPVNESSLCVKSYPFKTGDQPAISRTLLPKIQQTSLFNKTSTLLNNSTLQNSLESKNNEANQPVSNSNHLINATIGRIDTASPYPSTSQYSKYKSQLLELVNTDRYKEIHTNMKMVRNRIENQVDQFGKSTLLRTNCNKSRREITKALGQLVVGGGSNAAIVEKVIRQLRDSLLDKTECIDASLFTVRNRKADPGTAISGTGFDMNSDKLPIAFIYLMGALSKAICAQLVNEAAVKPQAASPIGILTAKIFSDPHLHWRGESLIDMLISKIFVACPVLFGIRGDESTNEGRARIGWRKIDGKFISEQSHFDRMAGISAGYAAISLRDFSRTRWKNPYPATNYWIALSSIVNTPREEAFSSQFVVLKGLIEHSFPRFISFYGDMAVAALQAALVEFPRRGPKGCTSVDTLKTLYATLQKDYGLTLSQ